MRINANLNIIYISALTVSLTVTFCVSFSLETVKIQDGLLILDIANGWFAFCYYNLSLMCQLSFEILNGIQSATSDYVA